MTLTPIDYILCAAGKGERFKTDGILTPKPLININNLTLLERSLKSLDFHKNDRLILITQKKDKVKSALWQVLENEYPFLEIIWLEINQETRGQLETFYYAKKHLRINEASVAIFNCDTYFRSSAFQSLVQDHSIQGIIPCVKAGGDSWSFCSVNSRNEVQDVKEKKRISPWATVGLYFFRDSKKLLKLTESELKDKSKNEKYVAPLYSKYLSTNELVKICFAEVFLPMGTPGQIKTFWKKSLKNVLAENSNRAIVVDLDNTITIDSSSAHYELKKPNIPIIKMMRKYRENGFSIIIFTARNMKTRKGDEGKVLAHVGLTTLEWLNKHNVPYDSIRFGKPYAENGFYVDDKAIRPNEFLEMKYEEIVKILEKE